MIIPTTVVVLLLLSSTSYVLLLYFHYSCGNETDLACNVCSSSKTIKREKKKRPEEAILFLPKLSGIDPGLCRNRLKKMCNSPVTDISMNSLTHYLKKPSRCQCAWKDCDTITYSCHFYHQLMWLFLRPWPSSTGNTCFIKNPLHQDVWLPAFYVISVCKLKGKLSF